METLSTHTSATSSAHLVQHMASLLHQWLQNTRTRRQLAELTSLELADIGISHSDRVNEISKPFWR